MQAKVPPVANDTLPAARSSAQVWRWPLTLIVLVGLLLGFFLYVFHSLRAVPGAVVDSGRAVLGDLRSVAEAFHEGTVTTTFASYATEVTGSSHLQFATLEQIEVFERTDEATVLWGQLELPDLVVRATAPVETTFFVDLEERWDFNVSAGEIRVVTPPIRFNRPAVDVSRLEYQVPVGSLLRDEDEALERLRRGISEMALARAGESVPLVRELGRRKIEEFVDGWLADRFTDADDYRVEVVFADEVTDRPLLTQDE